MLQQLGTIHGLMDKLSLFHLGPKDPAPVRAAAAEFVLEGLYAHRRISRSEERGFAAEERKRESHGADEARQRSTYRRQFN